MSKFTQTFSNSTWLFPSQIKAIQEKLSSCGIKFEITSSKPLEQIATISSEEELTLTDACSIGQIIANTIHH